MQKTIYICDRCKKESESNWGWSTYQWLYDKYDDPPIKNSLLCPVCSKRALEEPKQRYNLEYPHSWQSWAKPRGGKTWLQGIAEKAIKEDLKQNPLWVGFDHEKPEHVCEGYLNTLNMVCLCETCGKRIS
jgi:DNA-directed RNA polymerase subunit RPC12/RpoP